MLSHIVVMFSRFTSWGMKPKAIAVVLENLH